MNNQREFTGVFIPAHIWLSDEIGPMEKMLLGEIVALSQRNGWCYATRKHFATWMHCTDANVTYYLTKLLKAGFIEQVEKSGAPTLRRVVNSKFYGEQLPADETAGDRSNGFTPGGKAVLPLGSNGFTPLNTSINKSKIESENKTASGAAKAENNKQLISKEANKNGLSQPISDSLPVQPISNHVAIPTVQEIKPSQLKENGAATSDGRCAVFDRTTLPESYTTDTELRALMSRYYKGNPQEYEVGILNDAKGQRIGADGIKDCMVMWAAWMIENNKLRMQAHQLHQSFKRWVLREATTYKKHDMKTQDDKPATVSLNTKNFTFQ